MKFSTALLALVSAGAAVAQNVSDPFESFASLISDWATENQWNGTAGSHNLPVLLVPSAVTNSSAAANSPVEVHFGTGYFEVLTTYAAGDSVLKNTSVAINVPIWGRAELLAPLDIPLNLSKSIPVAIPGVVNGTIGFSAAEAQVLMNWDLDTPFAGNLNEAGISVFPQQIYTHFTASQLKAARNWTSQELAQLAGPRPPFSFPVIRNATAEDALLEQFLTAFTVDSANGTVAVQTLAANSAYNIDVSFLGIITLTGSIDPSSLSCSLTLYVNIPLAGRVSLAKITGSLITGVTAQISVVLVTGTANLNAKLGSSGKHDLYINAGLSITFIGSWNTPGEFKIMTLPF
ncbi:hypothetical protein HMN09_00207800 [Mycena chlorophos]|uniref:Uncharacterized protein n=1 Tax=Mycena chlorophos TaxID=658473 RepID=A0A8H6TLP4_MYCCL|nr:hypothetical protein HMN09_00207800 [Mycena chlorophos]